MSVCQKMPYDDVSEKVYFEGNLTKLTLAYWLIFMAHRWPATTNTNIMNYECNIDNCWLTLLLEAKMPSLVLTVSANFEFWLVMCILLWQDWLCHCWHRHYFQSLCIHLYQATRIWEKVKVNLFTNLSVYICMFSSDYCS